MRRVPGECLSVLCMWGGRVAQGHTRDVEGLFVLEVDGETKVTELELVLLREEDVFGFDVAVYPAVLVQRLQDLEQRLDHLLQHCPPSGALLCESVWHSMAFEFFRQVADMSFARVLAWHMIRSRRTLVHVNLHQGTRGSHRARV
jgi:hypothetical protein